MYKRAISGLVVLNLVFLFSSLCVQGIARNRQSALPVSQMKLDERVLARREGATLGIVETAVSGQRVVAVREVEVALAQEMGRTSSESEPPELAWDELEILRRIVEAEAGNQDQDGRLLVANVVLNRVKSEVFPDNVTDVVLQNANGVYQFSPVASGRIWSVKVSGDTEAAVARALDGEDISDGALYFAARRYADAQTMRWFDDHLTYLFEYGGHEFFR